MSFGRCCKLLICAVLLGSGAVALGQEEAPQTGPQNDVQEAAPAAESPVAEVVAENGSAPPAPSAIVPGSELQSMTAPLLRMVLSLAAVLALVGVFAWLAKRFRGAQLQGGLIQIVGGLSLGPKDRVVLLRVGEEEILVGMSPSGMRQLHVMNKPSAQFSLNMADTDKQG